MVEYCGRMPGEGSELRVEIGEQHGEIVPVMIMGDGMTQRTPEPFMTPILMHLLLSNSNK